MNKNENTKQFHSGNQANFTISVWILSYFSLSYERNIETEFVVELGDIVHFFRIATSSSVQTMES